MSDEAMQNTEERTPDDEISGLRERVKELERFIEGMNLSAALQQRGMNFQESGNMAANRQPPAERTVERQPWLWAIEDANGKWKDGESCVFGDAVSAKDEVDLLNNDLSSDSDEWYKVVPLYRDRQP
jgi:hypothetical protein